jgi:hypothetical protein
MGKCCKVDAREVNNNKQYRVFACMDCGRRFVLKRYTGQIIVIDNSRRKHATSTRRSRMGGGR